MVRIARTEIEFNALWDEYMRKNNAFIYESNELMVSIMYGKTGQYSVTIVRSR